MIFLDMLLVASFGALMYVSISLALTYFVHQLPRNPVKDIPNWGHVIDTRLTAVDQGFLEVWRIDPHGRSRGIILLAHGWGRNRGRMVPRARIFGKMGFTTVIHSARDHGGSSPCRFMNAGKFAEDIETVMTWLDEPVILYGHSAGAVGAIIAASRNPEKIRLLLLEACYSETRAALKQLYRWVNRFFGVCFAPMILFWMNLFYRGGLDRFSPVRLAAQIRVPVMIIHGEMDRRFPVYHAHELKNAFQQKQCEIFIAKGAHHSDSSKGQGYEQAVRRFLGRHLPS